MERRKFVLGAASAAGLLLLNKVQAGPPCPPSISGSSNNPACPSPTGSGTLAGDADGLNPGQWSTSIDMPTDSGRWDISWQNRTAFWDDVHREIQFMGKAQASVGGKASHYIYSEQNQSWRTITNDLYSDMGRVGGTGQLMYGHVWICTFDHTDDSGDYYYLEQDSYAKDNMHSRFRWFDRSQENGQRMANSPWKLSSVAPFETWNTGGTPNPGMLYHPNLFGPGRPGIFMLGTNKMSAWDKTNDEYIRIGSASGNYSNRRNTATLYVPGLDVGVIGNGKEGAPRSAIIIPANYNMSDNKPQLVPLPFEVSGGNGNNSAHMLLDPRDDRTVMLLERGGGRVWTNSDIRTNSWKLESYTHPFWSNFNLDGLYGRWTCCSIPRYGVVIGLETYSRQGKTIMWRPG